MIRIVQTVSRPISPIAAVSGVSIVSRVLRFPGVAVSSLPVIRFVLVLLSLSSPAIAASEFRGLWVDAWGAGFRNGSEVTALVAAAKDHGYNAIIPEIRLRGNCYYFPTYPNTEPRATNIAGDYDPLQDMITKAHAQGIEVHAWMVTNLVASSPPSSSAHVYNAHPEYLMKNSAGSTNIGEGYFIDPGNPAALAWNRNVVMDLVTHYNIDGINFDYIRYPVEDSGYNDVAIARYNAEYGLTGLPSPSNAQFKNWRRRQITDWLRTLYPDIIAVKPNMKVTADVFASQTDAYNARMQDWGTWMSGNMLDAFFPMNYTDNNTTYFNPRASNAVANRGARHCYIAQGAYLNSKENTVTQMLYCRAIGADGITTYDYRVTNNTGETSAVFFDHILANVFQTAATIPAMPWKTNPTGGYIRGTVTNAANGQPIYNATVSIPTLALTTQTGPDGRYAFLYIAPATYSITASGFGLGQKVNLGVSLPAGAVVTSDFSLSTVPTPTPSPSPTPSVDLIVDNDEGEPRYTETGGWTTSGYPGYNGLTYRTTSTANDRTAVWTANLAEGDYEILVIYVAGANRASSARYVVTTKDGPWAVYKNQQQNSLTWISLGTFSVNAGSNSVTLEAAGSTPSGTVVVADAVHFKMVSAPATPTATPSPSLTPSPTASPSPTPLPPEPADLIDILLGRTSFSSEELAVFDRNADGGIDVADLIALLNE